MKSSENLIHGFNLLREQEVRELRSFARQFVHEKTGARLLHLRNDDPNNLFCIAFRTPVFDSTGVPHILEHSVLGGSRKFPVKDPFQALLKGSLQTFLNALTYPDKTVYPVSSQVEKDFFNLVDVYCDAVFHPLLTETTFSQEGWHFDAEDPQGPVSIKGIVYNEMKGVFSDFSSHVVRKTMAELFPDTTYFYESGGEPEHITDLTYEQFKDFHRRYYHPANAFIFLYGNIPTEKTLEFLNDKYLSSFSQLDITSDIRMQPSWSCPRRVEIEAPSSPEDDGMATVLLSWIFGDTKDPVGVFAGSILSRYLLGTESSPLKRALIDSKLGEDLDDMCGFDSDLVQTVFVAGLRKVKPVSADKISELIFTTLIDQADKGLDADLLEGCIRSTEFSLREITDAGRFPYNLKLADRCLRSWLYDGDPLLHLAYEAPLETIKQNTAKSDAWFRGLIRDRLIANPHHLLSVVTASSAKGKKLAALTQEQAARLTAGFTDSDKQRYYQLTETLKKEQAASIPPEALASMPRLYKSDLPLKNRDIPVQTDTIADAQAYLHPLFCAGISYLDIGFDCSALPAELISYLPLYTEISSRCGAAGYSYEEMSKRMALSTGGISTSVMLEQGRDSLVFRCFFHGKSLSSRFNEMTGIFADLFLSPKLADQKLIGDILLEMRNDFNASVIGEGHALAATHAASHLDPSRALCEEIDGVTQLRFLDKCARAKVTKEIITAIQRIHHHLITTRSAVISLTADDPASHRNAVDSLLSKLPKRSADTALNLTKPTAKESQTGIEINASVNFVAKAWAIPKQDAHGLGTLSVLSTNLSRGYLWDKVRVEGGAYGSFASLSSTYPVYSCTSYRDPNLKKTLDTFEAGLRYLIDKVDQASVDETVIGTIGQVDKPRTPHGSGYGETCSQLLGRSKAFRQEIRNAILGASLGDIKGKAREIIDSSNTAVTILGNAESFSQAEKEGVMLKREPLLR